MKLRTTGRKNEIDWKKASCSCVPFLKDNICMHIVAIGYAFKQIPVDARAQDGNVIGRKAKRGRKPQAASAFIRD